jgi:uncharacterized protein YbbC (DUF1343 family)
MAIRHRLFFLFGAALLLPQLAAQSSPRPGLPEAPVQSGLDVLVAEDFAALKGRKVGLITNHTGIDRYGRANVDLLHASDVLELAALFGPEHGIRGEYDQAVIPSGKDEKTGLPVFSLYGETRKPTAEMLKGIDTLVFDIQDIGTRFYTYISTMSLAMHAAAEQGLRFVVLDRPNPIRGDIFAGPMLWPGKESFVAAWRLPVRHGMTVGEIAGMLRHELLREELELELDLQVIKMRGWHRSMWFEETGLYWVSPSPNMRNMHEALLYPGVGLLEFTNLSVGRGTDTPFERIGAPWMDGRRLALHLMARKLPGVAFQPLQFTPASSRFAGERCHGIAIVVTNRDSFLPLRTGIEIAHALRVLHRNEWKADRYQKLLGHPMVYQMLIEGFTPKQIERSWSSELPRFEKRREQVLLYD